MHSALVDALYAALGATGAAPLLALEPVRLGFGGALACGAAHDR